MFIEFWVLTYLSFFVFSSSFFGCPQYPLVGVLRLYLTKIRVQMKMQTKHYWRYNVNILGLYMQCLLMHGEWESCLYLCFAIRILEILSHYYINLLPVGFLVEVLILIGHLHQLDFLSNRPVGHSMVVQLASVSQSLALYVLYSDVSLSISRLEY